MFGFKRVFLGVLQFELVLCRSNILVFGGKQENFSNLL